MYKKCIKKIAVVLEAAHEKCIRRLAPIVEKNVKSPSNQMAQNLSIVGSAINSTDQKDFSKE
jgi:hypothetical protein